LRAAEVAQLMFEPDSLRHELAVLVVEYQDILKPLFESAKAVSMSDLDTKRTAFHIHALIEQALLKLVVTPAAKA
jgi:hypothetical protein